MTLTPEPPPALFCPTCAYDLRYTTEPRCPECGTPFDRNDLAISRIPWAHRKQKSLDTFKAWRHTVLLTLRHPTHLAREVALPVDTHAASRFRWLNVLLTAILLTAGVAILYPFLPPNALRAHINFTDDSPELTSARILAPCFALIDGPAIFLSLPLVAFATASVLSWWTSVCVSTIARKPVRPRAAALSLYLSAWLPHLALLLLANAAILLFIHDIDFGPTPLALDLILLLDIPTLFVWWLCCILLLANATDSGIPRATGFALLHPIGALFVVYIVPIATLYLLGLLALILVSTVT